MCGAIENVSEVHMHDSFADASGQKKLVREKVTDYARGRQEVKASGSAQLQVCVVIAQRGQPVLDQHAELVHVRVKAERAAQRANNDRLQLAHLFVRRREHAKSVRHTRVQQSGDEAAHGECGW